MYHISIGICLSLFLLSSSARVVDDDYSSVVPREELQEEKASKIQAQCSCKDSILQAISSCESIQAGQAFDSSSTTCSEADITKLLKKLKECNDGVIATLKKKSYSSCAEIKKTIPSSTSGKYDLLINGKKVTVYCQMGTLCGTGGGGWTRIAKVDMTISSTACPPPFKEVTRKGTRLCSKDPVGCVSGQIQSKGISYSQVCGRVRGYQKYTTQAFKVNSILYNDINKYYVDGISITHGKPRKHIWTLASGANEIATWSDCPCNKGSDGIKPPAVVGKDWYCESGRNKTHHPFEFSVADPLWDGKSCGGLEGPCCSSSLLPWFHKTIAGGPTTDDLEFRICAGGYTTFDNVGFDQYEFYVK